MLARGEARSVVEITLQGRRRTMPMTNAELHVFCLEMLTILEFTPQTDRMTDIRRWALSWETKRFQT